MELSDYWRVLKQRGWLIVLLAALTAAAAFGYSQMQTPVYKATARLLITSRPDFGQTQAARSEMRNYAAWLYSSLRAQEVIDLLQLDMTPQELMGDATVAAATAETIITIEVENTDPDLAKRIVRTWAEQLIIWRNERNADLRREDRIEAELIDEPQVALDRPQVRINTAAGAVFGALLGVLLIFVLEWLQSGVFRLRGDVERYLDIPVIGSIPGE